MLAETFHKALVATRSFSGWFIMAAIPIVPEAEKSEALKWAKSLGLWWIVWTAFAALVWMALEWLADYLKTSSADDPRSWSISVQPGMLATQIVRGKITRARMELCQITNHSPMPRDVDVSLVIPMKSGTYVWLRKACSPFDDWMSADAGQGRLEFPFAIKGTVRGFIDFEPDNPIDQSDTDWRNCALKVTDNMSAKSKTIRMGMVFDWPKGRVYRGTIGEPFPVITRIKLWWQKI